MFFGRHHHGLPRCPIAFLCSTIGEGESPIVGSEKYRDDSWVAVHDRFLMRTVLDAKHTHTIVFCLHCVMPRVNLNGISRDRLWFWSGRHFASVSSWIRAPGQRRRAYPSGKMHATLTPPQRRFRKI